MCKEMKDSGVQWIGDIPTAWSICKLKNIATITTGNTPPKNEDNYYSENGLPWIKPDNLIGFNGVSESKEHLSDKGRDVAKVVPENTLLICCIGSIGKFGYTNSPAAFNQQINAIEFNNKDILWKYGMYYMSTQEEQQKYYMNGNVVFILNLENQKKVYLPKPSLEEQHEIVNYLDKKVSQVDDIISKQKILIEKYKSYKQSLITETVTKGLNKNVPMKDSGIEWAQDIPQKWEVKKYKHVMYKKKDICFKYDGESVLSLTMKGVIVRDLENPMGKMPASFDGYQRLYVGNLLLCLFDIDVTPRCIGLIENDGLTSPAYSQFVMKDNNNAKYYMYLLTMIDDKKYFVHLSKNLRSSLTEDDFGVIKTIVPPIDEQKQIANFLDKKCNAIDSVISKKDQLIEELERYKKSLIYECVTGKRQVN